MVSDSFSFDPLPEGLMLPKPVNSVTDEEIEKLEKAGRLAITRKRDGYRIWALKDASVKLYTRGLRELTAHFPHIVAELERVMPSRSFLDGEMFYARNGKDDFSALSKICQADLGSDAVRVQQEIGLACYMVFDVVFLHSEKMISRPWHERHDAILKELVNPSLRYVFPVELLDCSFKEAQRRVVELGWEGLVVYDTNGRADFQLDGKVSRPRVAWKRKPIQEDDFIVRHWVARKDDPLMLREFILLQVDPESGQEVDCGKCGTGFSNLERKELANNALYPLVVEVQFFERFPSGKLRFPVFVRVRDDKKPEECIFIKADIPDK